MDEYFGIQISRQCKFLPATLNRQIFAYSNLQEILSLAGDIERMNVCIFKSQGNISSFRQH
uniref:Uncharacterized protein n=1 Tax=viral metagenome TaxID=1070528 RepID=A0A6C0C7R9_9ZZZZ